MTDLMRYAAALDGKAARALPPVEKWNPDYCGEIDLVIRRDGVWMHEGTPIGRAPLVRLFSTVLRKEGDRYFLVTPVEKLGIKVEDAPFTAVLMRVEGEGDGRRIVFTTNVGDEVVAGPDQPISYRASKPLETIKPADLGVDVTPRRKTLKVSEPPSRKAGIKVADVGTLVAKLKN